jgi:predicted RNA-binding Zn ribbon-like protein
MTIDQSHRPPAIFVGDHLALDFLNSRSTPSGVWTEGLGDGGDLIDWLEQAGAIEPAVATRFRTEDGALRRLDGIAERARDLREWLRAFVERHAGRELGEDAIAELALLNHLLAEDDSYTQVEAGGGSSKDGGLVERPLRQRRVRRWTSPEQLLQPIAGAIADLVCDADFRRIRACERSACTLVFLDRTKAHARRWCSMAVCGNRAKAAAYRARAMNRRA